MSLGSNIKVARINLALSQKELASKAKISDAYIALLETDQRTNPSLDVLSSLADALEVSIEFLLKGAGTNVS